VTLVNFVPSTVAAFQFDATMGGAQYSVVVTWNLFGERYYVNVYDASGALVVSRALTENGPQIQGSFTWDEGVATVALASPHNVPVGSVANVYISQTDSAFDGLYQALATGPTTFTYALATNPNESTPVSGLLTFPWNLVDGYIPGGWLVFNEPAQQFEFN
jgi:hypothetical protein